MKFGTKLRKVLAKLFSRSTTAYSHVKDNDNNPVPGEPTYIFPAEGEPHEATMLGFPSRCSLPLAQYDAVCGELVQLAAAIAEFEPIRIYVRPEDKETAETLINDAIQDISRVTFISCPINHCWVRDTGPVYVRDATGTSLHRRYAVNFRFNEWGNKKPEEDGRCWGQQWPVMDDEAIRENADFARWVIDHDDNPAPVTQIDSPIRLEGGALVTDGEGTLLITESCVVCEERNPGMSKAEIEKHLKRLLGIQKVIWFPGRRNADITDVHMDAEARFVRPGVLVYSKPHEVALDMWKDLSREIKEILDRETDAKGRHFEIHTIEEPDPRGLTQNADEELAASYVNFFFVNGGLILPKFGDKERDGRALETMQALLPERIIRQVYTNAIPLTGGVLHCVTQQIPAMK